MRKSSRQDTDVTPLYPASTNGHSGTPTREGLMRRALAALDTTPASIAARSGIDPRDLPLLLAEAGDPEAAERLAQVFERAGAELDLLARELTAAAVEGEH